MQISTVADDHQDSGVDSSKIPLDWMMLHPLVHAIEETQGLIEHHNARCQ